MTSTINFTPESIQEITHRITAKAGEIEYAITIPQDATADVAKGAPQVWAKVLECEYAYIDSARDDTEDIAEEVGLDLDGFMDANESLKVEHFWFPDGEFQPVSLEEFRVALHRAVVSDLASAWEALVRDVIEEVCGVDPLGGGDGLFFPADS